MNQIREDRYKDVNAVVLENDALRVTLTPEFGARTASIFYKPGKRELLWQNPAPKHARPSYAAGYEQGEFAGFDEMFPSISRCFYEDGPWAGSEMPDHGEVWSLPWEYSIESSGPAAEFTVHGVRFPYRLSKRVSLTVEPLAGIAEKTGIPHRPGGGKGGNNVNCAVFRSEYTAANVSGYDFDYIWAAHPLFNTHPGMEIVVPDGMDRIINAVPGTTLGPYGRELPFPGDGTLSFVPEKNDTGYQKYYFAEKVTEGWCLLKSPEWNLTIALAYPEDPVSFLGMWVNEGGFAGQYNIAPEPATAGMDRVDFSKMWGMNSTLPGGESVSWYLDIIVYES